MVRALDLDEIRDIYEIVGALEAQAAMSAGKHFGIAPSALMFEHDAAMRKALDNDDFSAYYDANLAFHESWLRLCGNEDLVQTVRLKKERLYDFPRREGYVREWELASVEEHREIAERFRSGDFAGAAACIRDVHWSFEIQEPYIRAYYQAAARDAKARALE